MIDKMKRNFFQAAVVSILLYGCTTWMLSQQMEKKLDSNYTRMLRAYIEQILETAPHKSATVRLPITRHEKISKSDKPDMRDTAGEVGTSS